MKVYLSTEFEGWVRRMQNKARDGHGYSRRQLELVVAQLDSLRALDSAPTEDSAGLRRVRQSKRHQVWRLSHPYEEGIAVRLIAWFSPDADEVVIALFAGEKARIGDVWYSSVGQRADMVIDQWLRGRGQENDSR